LPEVLEKMLDRLQLVQRALGEGYQREIALHTAVARACRGVPELENALLIQKPTYEALFADLRISLQIAIDKISKEQFLIEQAPYDSNYTDRPDPEPPNPNNFKRPRKKSILKPFVLPPAVLPRSKPTADR
jgi:hypothetical protein